MITVMARTTVAPSEPERGSSRITCFDTRTSVGVSGRNAAFAQLVEDGGVVDAQVVADSREGPAEVVEVDGVVDLFRRESTATHRHAAPVEDAADRPPFDAESVTEFVHGRAGPVAGDQLFDLIAAELPGPPRPVPLARRRCGCAEAGKLLAKLFEGPDLVFRVVTSLRCLAYGWHCLGQRSPPQGFARSSWLERWPLCAYSRGNMVSHSWVTVATAPTYGGISMPWLAASRW